MMQAENRKDSAYGARDRQNGGIPSAAEMNVEYGCEYDAPEGGRKCDRCHGGDPRLRNVLAASNCGSAKSTMPLLRPMVALLMPITQIGGLLPGGFQGNLSSALRTRQRMRSIETFA